MDGPLPLSVDDLSAELRTLKKRLYSYQLKGLELQKRARHHFLEHHIDSRANSADLKFGVFEPASPLSNEYILEVIAHFLPMQDIKSCRAVCRLWAREMLRCVQKQKILVISSDLDSSEAVKIVEEKRAGNYIRVSALILLEVPLETALVRDVIYNFGETLSTLQLDECSPTAQELYRCLKFTPNLEKFHLKGITMHFVQAQNRPALLDQLTSNSFSPKLRLPHLKSLISEDPRALWHLERLPELAPNLEYLNVTCMGPCQDINAAAKARWDSLQEMHISALALEGKFDPLTSMKLRLRKLTLNSVGPSASGLRSLSNFLKSLKGTLQHLVIDGGRLPYGHDYLMRIPPNFRSLVHIHSPFPVDLPNLKTLKTQWVFVNSLSILDSFPALVEFDCKYVSWKNWWHVLTKMCLPRRHESLIALRLGSIDAECLLKVAEVVPYLTELEVYEDRIDNLALRMIFKDMGNLKKLKIRRSNNEKKLASITDSALTGLEDQDLEHLNSKILQGVNFKELIPEADQLRKHPFVGNLKDLTAIEIDTHRESHLTNLSLYFGLSKLTKLKSVIFPKKSKITKGACQEFTPSLSLTLMEEDTLIKAMSPDFVIREILERSRME